MVTESRPAVNAVSRFFSSFNEAVTRWSRKEQIEKT